MPTHGWNMPGFGVSGVSEVIRACARTFGPFYGAGQRRTAERSIAAQQRRVESEELAERLVAGGLPLDEVYLGDEETEDVMFALDGTSLRDDLGRPRKTWAGYPDDAYRQKTRLGREYAMFAAHRGIEQIRQIVVRPPMPTFRLVEFHEWHSRHSRKLSELLRYARKARATGLAWDLVSSEIKNEADGGWLISGHFHISVRGCDDDELTAVKTYFEERGWAFWFPEEDDDRLKEHPCALVQYQAKGLADAIADGSEWEDAALAELRHQTRAVAMTRACGEFREWKSTVADADVSVIEGEDGKPVFAHKRVRQQRPKRKPQSSVSVTALRFCVYDYGDGLLRPSIRVRGRGRVSFTTVLATYEIDTYKVITAIPETSQVTETTSYRANRSTDLAALSR